MKFDAKWRKSSYSNPSGACVEVKCDDDGVHVRDTKDREGPMLSFDAETWRSFINGTKNGEFDL